MAAYNYPYNNTQNFTGYQPNAYAGNYQPYAYPYPTSTVQNQPQPQQSSSILTVFVNSEEEVNNYPVAAGVTVILLSFNMGKFYVKSTGKDGVPQQVRVFEFIEKVQPTSIETNQNVEQFATRDQLDTLSSKLEELINKLGGVE